MCDILYNCDRDSSENFATNFKLKFKYLTPEAQIASKIDLNRLTPFFFHNSSFTYLIPLNV